MDSVTAIPDLDEARFAFVDAVRRHEPALISGLYSPGARVVAPGTDVLRGRDEVVAYWGAGMDTGMTRVELVPEDVELLPAMAWEVGRYALLVEPEPGVELVDRGRYLLIYRLDDGRWTRAAEMFAPDLPAPTPGREP
ncbi:MAG TPA: nuclear transport factor 2 family protein [Candidatus Limnocylindrales bacterium]|nr:nuclear transport factor 2 family protein [Candidatus Limnocylindrales bacterium]